MAKHALLSPSSAKRWKTCPGSVLLSKDIPNTSNSYADEGTAAHFLGAECLLAGTNTIDYLGAIIFLCEEVTTGEHFECFAGFASKEVKVLNEFTVDEDMARYVQVYIDYVRDLVQSTNGTLFVEVSVPLDHMTGEKDAKGTSDVVILTDEEIIVVDLKYGMGVEVSAEENDQLLMYASGALRHFQAGLGDVKTVRVAICQPRVSSLPSEWSCSIEELRAFEHDTAVAALKTYNMARGAIPAEFCPSTEACRFCKAKPCAAQDKFVQEQLGADFDEVLTGPSPASKVPEYDNTVLSKRMVCLDLIEDWCKAVRAKVESELLQGHVVEGFKLVQGRKGARAWSTPEEAEELLKKLKLKKDQMYEYKLISPTTAEKLLGKDEAKWPKVCSIIRQAEGKPSVAPASDKRPAITVGQPSADDFESS